MSQFSNPHQLKGLAVDQAPRNSFNVSHRVVNHQPLGLIVPTYREYVNPNDYLDGTQTSFATTQPLHTTLFTPLFHNTDYYFTPYRLIWKHWDNFYLGLNDDRSMLRTDNLFLSDSTSHIAPYLKLSDLVLIIKALEHAAFAQDVHGYPLWRNALRLLDMLGYGSASMEFAGDSTIAGMKDGEYDWNYWNQLANKHPDLRLNVLPLLAFQCIHWTFFRNNQYQFLKTFTVADSTFKLTWGDRLPYWNIDHIPTGDILSTTNVDQKDHAGESLTANATGLKVFWGYNLFNACYAPYFKDRFSSYQPTINNADSAELAVGALSNAGYVANNPLIAEQYKSFKLQATNNAQSAGPTIQNVHLAYAMEKLGKARAMAGRSYNQQHDALFNSKKNYGCTTPIFIGSYSNTIGASEVTSQSDTYTDEGAGSTSIGSPLGARAGKIAAIGNGSFKCNAAEHGIVLGVTYFQPENEYNSDTFDDELLKIVPFDFYNPVFDNLGLQPLFAYKLGYVLDNDSVLSLDQAKTIWGYQARYIEYKQRVNEIHGEFQSGRSLSAWCTPRSAVKQSLAQLHILNNVSNLYVNPNIGDTIFVYNYDSKQDLDHFMLNNKYKVSRVSNMSELGIKSI